MLTCDGRRGQGQSEKHFEGGHSFLDVRKWRQQLKQTETAGQLPRQTAEW